MKTFIAIASLTLSVLSAHASGTRVGDGGHGVVCPHHFAPVFLDFYEATDVHGRIAPMEFEQISREFVLIQLRSRVARIMGERHPSLGVFDQAMMLNSLVLLVDGPIAILDDVGAVRVKQECRIEAVAVRGEDYLDGYLQVRRDFWRALSERQRALVLVHEGAHSWFGEPTSIFDGTLALRQFVGLLYTDNFVQTKTDEKLRKLLETRRPLPDTELTEDALR